MCLVAFQKNFRKIFSGIWCLEKKRENTNQKTQATTQKIHKIINDDRAVIAIGDRDLGSRSTARSRSRRDRDPTSRSTARTRSRLLREITIAPRTGAGARTGARDLGLELELAIAPGSSPLSCARVLSLSLSHFPEML